MIQVYKRCGVHIIDFLSFVDKHCCKKYLNTLNTYGLQNDITNKDVQKLFYHSMIESIIDYYIKIKILDTKVFYVDKLKLASCCLIGDNDIKLFLKFFIKFIKDIKNKLNINIVSDIHSFKTYYEILDTDAYLVENLNSAIKSKNIKSEKVYIFLEKCGLKKLSEIYKTDIRVKFWLK
jgi:hypothetical protein